MLKVCACVWVCVVFQNWSPEPRLMLQVSVFFFFFSTSPLRPPKLLLATHPSSECVCVCVWCVCECVCASRGLQVMYFTGLGLSMWFTVRHCEHESGRQGTPSIDSHHMWERTCVSLCVCVWGCVFGWGGGGMENGASVGDSVCKK